MAKAGEIEYMPDGSTVRSIVTIGNDARDAITRAEEFVREYFGDDTFVGLSTQEVGSTSKFTLYKVNTN